MERRIATTAGLASFTIFVALAIAEVRGWKMPTPLALALISLMGLLAVLALSVMSHGIWVVSSLYRHGWRLRWPFYNVHRVERSLYNGDGQIPTQTKSDAVNHIVEKAESDMT